MAQTKTVAQLSQETLSAVLKTDTKHIKQPHENQTCTCAVEGLQTFIVLIVLGGNSMYIL